jgi:thymidylate synthase ThyX
MITAKVIADSVNKSSGNKRITTFILNYPRFIHSELLTHRAFSRNSSSSRAIPIKKIIEDVNNHPAIPVHWGKTQKGMQADFEVEQIVKDNAIKLWLEARDSAVGFASKLNDLGLHKQVVNRVLEPFFNITVLVTATELDNFFKLRAHDAAQPEIRELAYKMLDAYNASVPVPKEIGEWHIPFGDQYTDGLSIEQKLKICVARAARVSYMNFEGDINFDKDYQLYDTLLNEGHYSPFEHAAQAEFGVFNNFSQWKQYRYIIQKSK